MLLTAHLTFVSLEQITTANAVAAIPYVVYLLYKNTPKGPSTAILQAHSSLVGIDLNSRRA